MKVLMHRFSVWTKNIIHQRINAQNVLEILKYKILVSVYMEKEKTSR